MCTTGPSFKLSNFVVFVGRKRNASGAKRQGATKAYFVYLALGYEAVLPGAQNFLALAGHVVSPPPLDDAHVKRGRS